MTRRLIVALAVLILVASAAVRFPSAGVAGNQPESAEDPALRQDIARQAAADAASRIRRQSAEEREARAASRSVYHGLGPAPSQRLAAQTFKQLLSPPLGSVRTGEKIKRYLNDHTAEVDTGSGKTQTLLSSLPLVTH